MKLTMYSRPGCHLCDDMKAIVERVAETLPLVLEEIDISTDPVLETRYGLEIPVLMIGERKAAKYRVTENELRRLLLARSDSEAARSSQSGGSDRSGGPGVAGR